MSQNSKVCPTFHSWLWECKEGNVHEGALTMSVCFLNTQYSNGKKGDRRKPILRGDGHRKFLSGKLYCGQRKVKPRGCLAMLRTHSIANLKMCSLVPAALVLRSQQVVAKRNGTQLDSTAVAQADTSVSAMWTHTKTGSNCKGQIHKTHLCRPPIQPQTVCHNWLLVLWWEETGSCVLDASIKNETCSDNYLLDSKDFSVAHKELRTING